ncbi:MAG: 50S ribosomal protein L6 [Candidatus Micrarchaeia archaeon]|jgi:large subunit ribosomal protein L6
MQVPSGITVEVSGGQIKVKGPKAELSRAYNPKVVNVKNEGGEITAISLGKETRKAKAAAKSVEAHLKNMFKGVQGGFEKKLSVVFAHFPVALEVKGDKLFIKNFLGEKTPRVATIRNGVKVVPSGQEITVSGNDKEAVGQTANNIRRAARITNKDIRVFQDGIYYS